MRNNSLRKYLKMIENICLEISVSGQADGMIIMRSNFCISFMNRQIIRKIMFSLPEANNWHPVVASASNYAL
jgi:hypothetical protein